MVSQNYLPSSDARRFPSRVLGPYPTPYQERRGTTYASHEVRNTTLTERDTVDDSPAQRKRIAVACGRCRKRKIRCSGDSGNGHPCTNCKNAGHEPCQFLRVASQEAPMKAEGVSYNFDLARQYHSRPASTMPTILPTISPYMDGITSTHADGMAYRGGHSTYPYSSGSKQYYSVGGFTPSPYAEDQPTEYPVYSSYPSVQDPSYMMGSYRMAAKSGSSLYVDSDPTYGYSTGPAPQSLVHRASNQAESTGYPFQSVDSLSSAACSSRLSPHGLPRSTLPGQQQQQHHQHLGRHDSMSPSYNRHSQSNGASPTSPATSFGGFDGPGVPGYPMASSLRGQNELYTTSSTSAAADAMMAGSSSPHRSAVPELTYRYTDTTRQAATGGAGDLSMGSDTAYMGQSAHHQHQHHHAASYMVTGDGHAAESDASAVERKPGRSALRA